VTVLYLATAGSCPVSLKLLTTVVIGQTMADSHRRLRYIGSTTTLAPLADSCQENLPAYPAFHHRLRQALTFQRWSSLLPSPNQLRSQSVASYMIAAIRHIGDSLISGCIISNVLEQSPDAQEYESNISLWINPKPVDPARTYRRFRAR